MGLELRCSGCFEWFYRHQWFDEVAAPAEVVLKLLRWDAGIRDPAAARAAGLTAHRAVGWRLLAESYWLGHCSDCCEREYPLVFCWWVVGGAMTEFPGCGGGRWVSGEKAGVMQ